MDLEVDNQIFEPIYSINDWEDIRWYIGHNKQISSAGTTGHAMQVDMTIEKPFTCNALFPDGTIEKIKVISLGKKTVSYRDMGNQYSASYKEFATFINYKGIEIRFPLERLYINKQTIQEI